jgi:iron complex outermembrane receptor protein
MPIGLIECLWLWRFGADDKAYPNRERHEASFMQTVTFETALLALAFLGAQAQKASPDPITLQIEELMNINVTSASTKEQKISKVAAAIFVISEEDIRRSAATNIPDLLRMVLQVAVAQINPSTWAISALGFNGEYSAKLLVLIDGRTVYTPPFSGVYWDSQARLTWRF